MMPLRAVLASLFSSAFSRRGLAAVCAVAWLALEAPAAEHVQVPADKLFIGGPNGDDTELLERLGARDDWEGVTLYRTRLDARVMDAVARCPGIRWLHLSGARDPADDNRWRLTLGEGTFAAVARMEKLEDVVLAGVPVDVALTALASCPALTQVYMESFSAFDESAFEALARYPALESLTLNGGRDPVRVSRRGLEAIARCATLRELSLHMDPPVDADIALDALAPLSDLRSLLLNWSGFDDRALARFAEQWPEMTCVFLPKDMSEAAARTLAKLPALTRLSINDADDDAARRLAAFPGLRDVSLGGKRLTDDGVAALAVLPELRKVSLDGEQLTGKALAALAAGPPNLREVFLFGGRYVDADFDALAAAPELRSVILDRAFLTPEGEEAFKRKRPDVRFSFFYRSAPIQSEPEPELPEEYF